MKKTIAIMGSTGSIGTQTLDVVRNIPGIKVAGLSAGRNTTLLEQQAREFLPELVVIDAEKDAADLKVRLADTNIRVSCGMEGLLELAALPGTDMFVNAIVGMIGIRPTLAAIRAGKDIAFANKETLVCAGHLIMPLVRESGTAILPVDSEHSAIFQCLQVLRGRDENAPPLERIWLTASGGPFRGMTYEELKTRTAADALKHPNWSMGSKITIDSASMVNKGLEVIEAKWLFHTDPSKIQVILQPQSIIHSMVEFSDGTVMAQLGAPDMRLPIQYALTYPARLPLSAGRLDFSQISCIAFENPDMETFKGLPLAYQAIQAGGSMPTVLNAANEEAVALFLAGKIGFTGIYDIIEEEMGRHRPVPEPSLEVILETEAEVRSRIRQNRNS